MTPDLRVTADGRDITSTVADRLLEAEVVDALDEADAFNLTLDDRPPGVRLPPTGAELVVELGYLGRGVAPMGRYVVDEVELSGPPATLTVRAAPPDLRGEIKAPRTRSWSDYTIGRLVGAIASRHGLEPRVDEALAGVALPHVDQVDESDLNLLRRLASYQLDVAAKVADGRLVFVRREVLAHEAAEAAVRIVRSDAAEYRVLRADREMYSAVVAHWREFSAGELQAVRAGELMSGPVYQLPETFPDRVSAANASETKLRALRRGVHTGQLTLTPGRPDLAADVPVELTGWRAGVDGVWMIRRARHALGRDGYRTAVDIEAVTSPWRRAAAQG